MSHPQQQAFVARIARDFPQAFRKARVLEIGSLDINGSVRQHFVDCDYVGVDLGEGPGVDVIAEGQAYDAPDASFDTVVSCETMEHNPYWRETFENMIRLCRPGGLVMMTCGSTLRAEHGTRRTTPQFAPLIPWEYYGNRTARDFKRVIPIRRHFSSSIFCQELTSHDLYFAGFKAGAPPPPRAASVLGRLRRAYLLENARNWRAVRTHLLIRIIGEERYMAGPVLQRFRRR